MFLFRFVGQNAVNRGNRNYFYYGFTTSHESNHNILYGTKWHYARCSINGNAMIK